MLETLDYTIRIGSTPGNLRFGRRELNLRLDSCKQPTGKQYIRTKVRPVRVQARLM